MKLLILTGIFPPAPGGPATYSKLIAQKFAARGHQVRVITYSTPSLSSASGGGDEEGVVRISRSWFKPWHYFKYYRAVRKYGRDADILFAQDPVSAGYPTYLAAKALKKPYVVKITGDYSWEQARNRALTDKLIAKFQTINHHPWPINKIRDIQIRVCKEAKAIVTPSEYLKRLVVGWGVKEKRVHIIYNAVESVPEISRAQARRELAVADEDFLILSIGRNVPWKGFDVLREVVAEAFKPPVKLVILNDANREITHKYFRAADIFVLNTGYEGFSHVVLEAMSAGLPVITTNVGGNPEVVDSPENGILIEYNNREQLRDAILKLYNDPNLRRQLVQNSKSILSKFSLETMLNQTEALLTKAAER